MSDYKFRNVAGLGIVITFIPILLLSSYGGAYGGAYGGGSANQASGAIQTPAAQVVIAAEVLQFSMDTTSMTYAYKTTQSGSEPTIRSGTGTLVSKNLYGSYNLSASSDSFIQSGMLFPIQKGLLAGHVLVNPGKGAQKIQIFGT